MFFDGNIPQNYKDVLAMLGGHIETVIAVGGTIIGAGKTLSEHSKGQSTLTSKRNEELQRAGELAGHYQHLIAAPLAQEYKELLQQQVQERIQECVSTIKDLDQQLREGEKDPNWKLSTWKKVFLWYKPLGWRESVPHVLTYICSAAAVWFCTQIAINWENNGPSHPMLAFMLLAFAFVFHYWSFDGRRRELGYRKELGQISRLLLIQAPENGRMLLGQICFFLCGTLSLALVAFLATDHDSFRSGSDVGYAAALVLVALMYTSIFHGWAWAELKRPRDKRQLAPFSRALFKNFFRQMKHSGWAKLKFIFAFCLGSIPCLACIFAAVMLGTDGLIFTFFFLGLFAIFLVPIYGALRTVRINYSLSQPKELAIAAKAS
jgi:hypothetical protein